MIAEASFQTLTPESNEWDEDEFVSELDRRLEEALSDPTTTMSWAELKQTLV